LFTSLAMRDSDVVVDVPAGSVQLSVARIGDTPSQTNECVREVTEVEI
jgi:hypothetical protein